MCIYIHSNVENNLISFQILLGVYQIQIYSSPPPPPGKLRKVRADHQGK